MCMVGVPEQNFEMWCVVSFARCALSSLLSRRRTVTELIVFLPFVRAAKFLAAGCTSHLCDLAER